jgi:hypothetical protein
MPELEQINGIIKYLELQKDTLEKVKNKMESNCNFYEKFKNFDFQNLERYDFWDVLDIKTKNDLLEIKSLIDKTSHNEKQYKWDILNTDTKKDNFILYLSEYLYPVELYDEDIDYNSEIYKRNKENKLNKYRLLICNAFGNDIFIKKIKKSKELYEENVLFENVFNDIDERIISIDYKIIYLKNHLIF